MMRQITNRKEIGSLGLFRNTEISGKIVRIPPNREFAKSIFRTGIVAVIVITMMMLVAEMASAIQLEIAPETEHAEAPIDLDQAIQLAIQNDPVHEQILWDIEKTKGLRFQAGRLPNPTVGIDSDEIGNAGSGGQYGIFWSRDMIRSNRLAVAQQVHSFEIQKLEQSLDVRRLELARMITNRFLEVGRLNQEFQVITAHIDAVEEVQTVIKNLLQIGEVSQIDTTSIDIDISRLKQGVIEKQIEIKAHLASLRVRLDPKARQLVDPVNQPELPIEFDWTTVSDQLINLTEYQPDPGWIASHPQIRFAMDLAEKRRCEIGLAQTQTRPDYQVQASVNYGTGTEDVFAAFQVGVPLLTRDRKSGAISAAQAEYHRAVEFISEQKLRLQKKLVWQAGERQRLISRAQNIRDEILPIVDRNLEQIKTAYRAGETQFLQLKAGLDQALATRLSLVDAQYQVAIAQVQLETLLIDD